MYDCLGSHSPDNFAGELQPTNLELTTDLKKTYTFII